MADIDLAMLGDESAIGGVLVAQLILAAVAGTFGYLAGGSGGRSWTRVGFPLVLLLAAAACGGTVYRCYEAWEFTTGRLEGRIPGPHMPPGRAENHLDRVWNSGLAGVVILAVTVVGSGLLHRCAYRRRAGGSVA